MSKKFLLCAAAMLPLLFSATAVDAKPAVMVQAKECEIIEGGPGFGTCTETHNQVGLFTSYVDEVTPLHPYLDLPPMHTFVFLGNEWFSNLDTDSATVSYFVKTSPNILWIDHFVLWNEESSGIGVFNLWYGLKPGDKLDLVLDMVSPPDSPFADYGPTLWEFDKRPTEGWWTLEMFKCPQPDPGTFPGCAVGEVAWGGNVPEPGTWAMMIAGFGLVGWAARNRRQRLAHG